MSKIRVPEREVLASCLELLRFRMPAPGGKFWRNNTGGAMLPGGKSGTQLVRFGAKDSADILGSWTGTLWCVECKATGAKPRPGQVQWLREMGATGAVACWVDSVETLETIIDRVLAGARVEIDPDGSQYFG